jgi:hypothetical protein
MSQGTDDSIEDTAESFWAATRSHLKNAEMIGRLAGTGIIIFGLIATVGGIVASSPSSLKTWSASTIGIWGAGLAVICAVIQKILEKDHIALLEQAKVSLDRTQAYLYQRNEIKRQIEDELWLNLVFEWFEGWRRIWLNYCCETACQPKEIHHHGND